jgi:hypothetical protein
MLFLFATGLFPFGTYALPAAAGLMLVPIYLENGPKTAYTIFAAVSLVYAFNCPDRDAALMFVCFFGFYPIARFALQRLRPVFLRAAAKLGVFAVTMSLAYRAVIVILGIPDDLRGISFGGVKAIWWFLAAGCAVFLLYDRTVGNLVTIYWGWFRPRFLKRSRS